MSGIAGIFHLDGRLADPAVLQRMTDAIAHRGPDGSGHWRRGPVALGHRMLHTTPESLLEQQPLTDESGEMCLVMDGRVDNREELRRDLKDKGARLRSDTDAELVLRAYQCWGEECPARIVGDFALAIWDGAEQKLFCARDVMGLRAFFYYVDAEIFLLASEVRPILEHPAVRRIPNEGMIAEYLSPPGGSLEETLYKGILRLPRAFSMTVRRGAVSKRQYWNLAESRPVRYSHDADYTEHFRQIFREAVRCRLRSCSPVGLELSGGLDSSSIAVMAESLFRDGAMERRGIETFSMVFPGEERDESVFSRAVVQKWNLSHHAIAEPGPPASYYSEQIQRDLDFPTFPGHEMFNGVSYRLRAMGGKVLLTGDGGDQWLAGSPVHCADQLRQIKVAKLYRQLRWESQILSSGATVHSPQYVLLRNGIFPLLPEAVQQTVRRLAGKGSQDVPEWIPPEFAARTDLAKRIRQRRAFGGPFAAHALKDDFVHGWNFPWYHMEDRYIGRLGMEYRHPFLDRRLMEFCVGLPPDQRRRGNHTKFILRQAMHDFLPDLVRDRVTKAHYGNPAYRDAIEHLGGESFFHSLTIASQGWVDGARVRDMFRHMDHHYRRNHPAHVKYLFPLWMICAVELWFRNVFGHGATSPYLADCSAEPATVH